MLKMKKVVVYWMILLIFTWGNSFAQGQAQESEDSYLANRAFGDGFYEIALKHFQKYLKEYPEVESGEIQIFISRCYLNLDKFAEALHTLQGILDKSLPEDKLCTKATYWTAQTYFAAKDYESADTFFEKIIQRYPDSKFLAESFYYRASCYYKRRQYNKALELYQEFNKRFAKHKLREESSFRIAQCLYNIKDYAGAHKEFNSFIKRFPESLNKNATLYYLGEIEYIRGNFNKAIQYYIEASEVSPESKIAAFAKYGTGWAYLKLGRYKEGLAVFNRLQEMPDFGPALEDSLIFAQARCNAYLQNYAGAIKMYQRIINDFSHSSWFDDAYFWKGQAHYELARYPQACQTYEEAIEKFSKRAKVKAGAEVSAVYEREDFSVDLLDNLRYNLGWTYARMKRYTQAIEQFKKVYQDSRDRFLKSRALSTIGDIYLEQGNTKEAIENYDTVLTDFPNAFYADYAQYQLGIALSREKRFDSAILAFNALTANFPQSKYLDKADYQISSIYFRQGKFYQAEEQLENLIKEFPKSPLRAQASFLKAYAYYNNKNYQQAYKGFRDVLRLSTQDSPKMKAQYQIGFCFYQMGREDAAVKEFKRFLTLYPATDLAGDVLFWLGQYYFRQKKFSEARVHFTNLRQDFPHSELVDDAAFWQAKTLIKLGKPEAALDELQNLQTQFPNSEITADAILLKGDIFKSQGKIDQAKDLYKSVCTKFKETYFARIAHKKRAQILQEQRLFPEAIEQYCPAIGSDSDDFNAQIQFAIAQCREEQNEFAQALDEYLKVCYLYPQAADWSRKARLKCAQIFEKQALWKKAKSIYETLANEDNPQADFARKRLKALGTVAPQ